MWAEIYYVFLLCLSFARGDTKFQALLYSKTHWISDSACRSWRDINNKSPSIIIGINKGARLIGINQDWAPAWLASLASLTVGWSMRVGCVANPRRPSHASVLFYKLSCQEIIYCCSVLFVFVLASSPRSPRSPHLNRARTTSTWKWLFAPWPIHRTEFELPKNEKGRLPLGPCIGPSPNHQTMNLHQYRM